MEITDFSKGSVKKNIVRLAVPMTLAQLINVLYNIVDRIYIGRLEQGNALELTGLGVCLPVISIIIAFANLIGMGGAPLFSIQRGKKDDEEAAGILGNCFVMLLLCGVFLTVVIMAVKKPVLYLLGASDQTYVYADAYLTIYLFGTVFVMLSLGLNQFISAQGFGTTGMLTIVIGAGLNIVLDPVFIYGLHMGVRGSCGGYSDLPVYFGGLDPSFSSGKKGGSPAAEKIYAPAEKADRPYTGTRSQQFYHGSDEFPGADGV